MKQYGLHQRHKVRPIAQAPHIFTTLFFPVRAKSPLSLECRSGENVQENKRSSKSSGLQMIPSTLNKCRKKQPIYFPVAPFHVGNQWTNNWALKPKLDSNACECCMFIVQALLTFTTLWKHSAPLRDLGITSWEKGFLFSSDNDSCCVRASSIFLHNVLQYKFHIFDIISHVKQQPFCSFVATATLEVIGLYSKINGRILS